MKKQFINMDAKIEIEQTEFKNKLDNREFWGDNSREMIGCKTNKLLCK